MRHLALCLAVLALSAVPVPADEQKPADSIDRLIERLDADALKTREAAQAALIRRGKAGRPALVKALASSQSLEQKSRIRAILRALLADGAKIVDGLRIRLSVDRKEVKLGGAFTLTLTYENVSDKPFRLFIGDTGRGPHFPAGIGLISHELPGGQAQRPGGLAYMPRPGHRPIVVRMSKGDKPVVHKIAVFVRPTPFSTGGKDEGSQVLLRFGTGTRLKQMVTNYGKRTFAIDWILRASDYVPRWPAKKEVQPAQPRGWTGNLVSNVVTLTIKRK